MELVQEVLHARARRTGDRAGAARLARQAATRCRLHEVSPVDWRVALALFEPLWSASTRMGPPR
ncbi:MAG: hypothetical protein ACRD1K_18650 [Acidimicrobiales bacterium]